MELGKYALSNHAMHPFYANRLPLSGGTLYSGTELWRLIPANGGQRLQNTPVFLRTRQAGESYGKFRTPVIIKQIQKGRHVGPTQRGIVAFHPAQNLIGLAAPRPLPDPNVRFRPVPLP